jgi:hypothetical protein
MDPGSSPIADALNTKPKYVASNPLTGPRWAHTTVLSGDLAAAIGELKPSRGASCRSCRRMVEVRPFADPPNARRATVAGGGPREFLPAPRRIRSEAFVAG